MNALKGKKMQYSPPILGLLEAVKDKLPYEISKSTFKFNKKIRFNKYEENLLRFALEYYIALLEHQVQDNEYEEDVKALFQFDVDICRDLLERIQKGK